MAMPTTIGGRAAIQSSLVRAWGLEGYARIQRTVCVTDVSSDADFQRFYNRFYRVRRNAEWQSSYYAIMERGEGKPLHGVRGRAARDARAHGQRGGVLHQQDDRHAPSRQTDMGQPGARKARKGTTAKTRLENAIEVYGQIVSWYETYLATDDAKKNIRLFDELLPDYAWLTPVKKVDFLLWSER